jgi:hypothetical protein
MEMKAIQSSNIKAAGFDNGVLRVRFGNGTEYDYTGVPEAVYRDFLTSKSQGKYFHANIRSKYVGQKVEATTDGEGIE